jgi:hypothetical protein
MDRNTVQESLFEVLDVLRNSHLLTGDETVLRYALVQAVLDALNCNGTITPPPPDGIASSGAADVPAVGRTDTVDGKYGYVLIQTLDSRLPREIEGLLGDVAHGHYEGLIVDLRYAAGDAADSATRTATALRETKVPVAMLINNSTVGAAEILVRQVRERCDALVLGQPTRGFPYARRRTVLKSGDILLLPDVPEAGAGRVPLLPDLAVEDNLSLDALLNPPARQQDACLRKAVDLLSAIRAFQGRHF